MKLLLAKTFGKMSKSQSIDLNIQLTNVCPLIIITKTK